MCHESVSSVFTKELTILEAQWTRCVYTLDEARYGGHILAVIKKVLINALCHSKIRRLCEIGWSELLGTDLYYAGHSSQHVHPRFNYMLLHIMI